MIEGHHYFDNEYYLDPQHELGLSPQTDIDELCMSLDTNEMQNTMDNLMDYNEEELPPEFFRSPSVDIPVSPPRRKKKKRSKIKRKPKKKTTVPLVKSTAYEQTCALPHDSKIINQYVPMIKKEHQDYTLLKSKSPRRLLPGERTNYIRNLATIYIDAAQHNLQIKNNFGHRVDCPAMWVLHDSIYGEHGLTYVVCRRPSAEVKEYHNLDQIRQNGTLWRLVVQQQKFKLKDKNGNIYSITHVRQLEDCSASNWNSFAIVRVDDKERVKYIIKFDELRIFTDLYMCNKHQQSKIQDKSSLIYNV